MIAALVVTVLQMAFWPSPAPRVAGIPNPCMAPNSIGDAAGFYSSPPVVESSPARSPASDTAEIQMASRLIDKARGEAIGWMYVDQFGARWVRFNSDAGAHDLDLFFPHLSSSPSRFDSIPFKAAYLPAGIEATSCEVKTASG